MVYWDHECTLYICLMTMDPCAQEIWYADGKAKRVTEMKTCQKPYKFNLKVRVFIWIMDVRDTLSKGDTPMCQIWYAHVKQKQKNG